MKFEWDETKAKSNLEKHEISFAVGSQALEDEDSLTVEDTRRNYGEQRWIVTGLTVDGIVTVVFTEREGRTRIISARKASAHEKQDYYDSKNDL